MFSIKKKQWHFSLILMGMMCAFITMPSLGRNQENSLKVPLPASVIGTWQVSEAHIDTRSAHTPSYRYNDPRLTQRVLSITQNSIMAASLGGDVCTGTTASFKHMDAFALVGKSMAGRATAPEQPTPKDYKLPLEDNAPVDVISVNCKENGLWGGELGADGGVQGAWIVVLPGARLAMRWEGETILLLDRIGADTKPQASFSCEKAESSNEIAICGSIALAGYDRSVATYYGWINDAFKRAKDEKGIKRLSADQKKWIKEKRDVCGANTKCLEHEMAERLETLASIYADPEWSSRHEDVKK